EHRASHRIRAIRSVVVTDVIAATTTGQPVRPASYLQLQGAFCKITAGKRPAGNRGRELQRPQRPAAYPHKATSGSAFGAISGDEPVQDQEQDCAEDGNKDATDRETFHATETDRRRYEPADESATDDQQDGDDEAAGIVPRHDPLRDGARDGADDEPG